MQSREELKRKTAVGGSPCVHDFALIVGVCGDASALIERRVFVGAFSASFSPKNVPQSQLSPGVSTDMYLTELHKCWAERIGGGAGAIALRVHGPSKPDPAFPR